MVGDLLRLEDKAVAVTDFASERIEELVPDEAAFAAAAASLPEWRRRRCEELRFASGRRQSVAAWLLLARLVAARGLVAEDLPVVENEFGKPDFAPSVGLRFSLSHAKERVMAALADGPVGCDVERIAPIRPGVPEECLSPDELATLAAASPADRPRVFTRLWTRKEALGKMLGLGLGEDPRRLRVLDGDFAAGRRVTDLEFGDGFLGAVCTEAPGEETAS